MNEQDASSIGIETDCRRKGSEERLVVCGDVRFRPRQGLVTAALLVGLSISTAAVIPFEADAVVIVAHDCWNLLEPNPLSHLVRERSVADQITQAVQPVELSGSGVCEYGLERRQIPMNIADDRQSHLDYPLLLDSLRS